MQYDQLLPLEAVPIRARRAILDVFDGRWPSVREVARISDKQWLATPGVGPTVLWALRQVAPSEHGADNLPCASRLSDDKLLARLERLQNELQRLDHLVRNTLAEPPRNSKSSRKVPPLHGGSAMV